MYEKEIKELAKRIRKEALGISKDYVGGYAVSPDRYDYRISFDELERGVHANVLVDPDEDSDFNSFAENADEKGAYACWFD